MKPIYQSLLIFMKSTKNTHVFANDDMTVYVPKWITRDVAKLDKLFIALHDPEREEERPTSS